MAAYDRRDGNNLTHWKSDADKYLYYGTDAFIDADKRPRHPNVRRGAFGKPSIAFRGTTSSPEISLLQHNVRVSVNLSEDILRYLMGARVGLKWFLC